MPDDALVAVETFVNPLDAELARGALEAAGIEAALSADDGGGAFVGALTPGFRLMVRSEDVERARRVLMETAKSKPGE